MLKVGLLLSLVILAGCAAGPQQPSEATDIRHNEIKSTAVLKGKQVLLGGIVLSEPEYTQRGKYLFKISSVALDDQYKPVRKRKVTEAPIFEVMIKDIPQSEGFSVGSEVTVLGTLVGSTKGYRLDPKEVYLWTNNPTYQKVFVNSEQIASSGAGWFWYCKSCERIQPSLIKKKRKHVPTNSDRPNFGRSAYKNPYKAL